MREMVEWGRRVSESEKGRGCKGGVHWRLRELDEE